MEYKPEKLQSYAEGLQAKAVLLAIFSTSLGAVIPAGITFGVMTFFALLSALMAGLAHHPAPQMGYDIVGTSAVVGFMGGIFGLMIGIGWGQNHRVRAQEILCMVEQEKHLRHIAERMP